MEKFKDSPTVSIKMDTIVNKLLLSTSVKDTDLQVNQVNVEPFNLVFEEQDLILINNNLEHYNYADHDFYAESLHLKLDLKEEISTYQLVNS